MSRVACLPEAWNHGGSKLLFFPKALKSKTAESEALSPSSGLGYELLRGRLTEVSGAQLAATHTLAVRWLIEAQRSAEITAWIQPREGALYPPDLSDAGVDLDRLVIVRAPNRQAATRSADLLLRSGGVGLLILDLFDGSPKERGWMSRLLGLAIAHRAAVVCLTSTPADRPSLASIIGLRLTPELAIRRPSGFRLTAEVLKDKRGNPHRRFEEVLRGPLGLR